MLGDATVFIELLDEVVTGLRIDEAGNIEGLDEGFSGILGIAEDGFQVRVGGKRRLIVPPSLAYGSSGAGSIPGNSWLVFEIDLLGAS